MYKTHFDNRRALFQNIGLPRELLDTQVESAEHRAVLAEQGIKELISTDETPIPHPEDREGYYGDRHLEYWLSGFADFRKLLPYLEKAGGPKRYLDVGGSSGRVARHAARDSSIETWLIDININWVEWVDRYFSAPVRAFQNRAFPALPIESGYFSAISAFSVFTHLDYDEMPWLLELARLLRPGGYLYLTVLDEGVWDRLKTPNYAWLRDSIARGNKPEEFSRLCESPMPGDRFVWSYSNAESYNVNTFLSRAYLKKKWSLFLDIVEVIPDGHNYQTVVVLQKPKA